MFNAILVTGLIAGVLDGLAAVLLHLIRGGRTPERIFNFIASGVFGPSAMTGGTPMVIAGIGFHMVIATIWTAIFFFAARQFDVLRRQILAASVAYGIFVWIMMNKVVLPLSRVQLGGPPTWSSILIGATVLVVCIGLPVAVGAQRYFNQRPVVSRKP
jgi:hypothetical protein